MLNTLMKVYWIRANNHSDIYTEGYVGITKTDGRGSRIWAHFNKLKNNSHPNPVLQNAYNKHKDLVVDIVFEGGIQDCIQKEIELRPNKEIGWNILAGGGLPPCHAGYHWYNNGVKNCFAITCPEGFQPGKIQKKGKDHGHFGKKKNYKSVQKFKFTKGSIPWNKGIKGISKPIVDCPHCGKNGGISSMKRWHFDNCKEKTNE